MSGLKFLEMVLSQTAKAAGLTNFKLLPDEELLRGDGFLSEFHSGKIQDLDTGKTIHLYIKLPLDGHSNLYPHVFVNELHYYSTILPELKKFEESKRVSSLLKEIIPKFYCGSLTEGQKYVVMEDLIKSGFVLHDKSQFMPENTLKIIFETYGKYHAVSWAYKHHYPEKYQKFFEGFVDIFPLMFVQRGFATTVKNAWEVCYQIFNSKDQAKGEKIRFIVDNFDECSSKTVNYRGAFSTLLHGDCWSNNIMLNYDEKENGKVNRLKLLDHQMIRNSTPVHDLSYFFYSAASKKDFDKLDDYLHIYYTAFNRHLQEFGVDNSNTVQWSSFKDDWKEYALVGINMSLILWPAKLMSKDVVESLSGAENMHDAFAIESKNILNGSRFKMAASDLVQHAFEYGIL